MNNENNVMLCGILRLNVALIGHSDDLNLVLIALTSLIFTHL